MDRRPTGSNRSSRDLEAAGRLRDPQRVCGKSEGAYGQVVQVHIILDRDTGLPRGFAFVEMTNEPEAEKAIKGLNGSILRDHTPECGLRST
jgi:hypothetical protein